MFEEGTIAAVKLLGRNTLIGGVTGSGKSGILNGILALLTGCHDVEVWGIDRKGGMELGPWAPVLGRLATTVEEVITLLQDAVAEIDERARHARAAGIRSFTPTAANPALFVVIDEYAELPEDAHPLADTIARLGRAVGVNLIVATQRPTQEAMGHGAVRSQMDVRICLRVRERKDADLILGQGMREAGWAADQLDAPGKFYLSAPEHTKPIRARAYLITDHDVNTAVARNQPQRNATIASKYEKAHAEHTAEKVRIPRQRESSENAHRVGSPEQRLWSAVIDAPFDGVSVATLTAKTGMSERWVYARLAEHHDAGRVTRIRPGRYRANPPQRPDAT